MTLSDLAAIGGFVSGLAVVVTLVFLLLQMRQQTQSLRASMQQGRAARIGQYSLQRTEPFLSEAIVRAVSSDLTLNSAMVQAFLAHAVSVFFNLEDVLLQHRSGNIDQANLESELTILRGYLAVPAYRTAWRINRDFTAPDYRDFVDKLMRETKVVPFPDFSEVWKKTLSEELAAT